MIELIYAGHLGNNLFNYALGRILSEELGLALTCRVGSSGGFADIEERSGIRDKLPGHLGLFEDTPQELPGRRIEQPQIRYVMGEKLHWNGQALNFGHLLRAGRDRRIVLYGYFQRSEYYLPYAARIRKWFRFRPMDPPFHPGPRDVFVHVRRSLDMRVLDRRMDVSYYVRALEGLSPEKVVVCGLGLDQTLRSALAPFHPEYVDLDAGRTLAFMTRFRKIVMANSTFSWWGAFLSEAERIVFPLPVRGIMSPDHLDMDLRVPESRYSYVEDVPLEPWRFLRSAAKWTYLPMGPTIAVMPPGNPVMTFNASPALESLLRWLSSAKDAFGLHELAAAGFGARHMLARVLIPLLESGVLEACGEESGDLPVEQLLAAPYSFGVS